MAVPVFVTDFFSIINQVPAPTRRMPKALQTLMGSRKRAKARRIVNTVPLLSTGVTLLTSPNCKALK